MNDLLEQFLIECRELIDAATADLLALETSPQDQERLDGAFRGFHTLKGAAGIVGFSAMGRILHAAESILDSIRAGKTQASGALIGECLACLDQVASWLDSTEAIGDVPPIPDSAADALVDRLAAHAGTASELAPANLAFPDPAPSDPVPSATADAGRKPPDIARSDHAPIASGPAPAAMPDVPAWTGPLLARHATQGGSAQTALRFTPTDDCFFRGEDPLAWFTGLPGILAFELAPAKPWPPLDEFNPFECNAVISVISAASPEEVSAVLQQFPGRLEICRLPIGEADLSPTALAVLEEQMLVGVNDEPAGFAGRIGSAAQVAINILNRTGRGEAARTIANALALSQGEGRGDAFVAALRSAIRPTQANPAEPAADTVATGRAEDPATRIQLARNLRVDVDRIDALVTLTGELTIVKNALGHTARLARDGADLDTLMRRLKNEHALLDRLVGELQRSVLGIRVLPLSHVFQHFSRLVREIAHDLGKSVRLAVEGQTTEADKAIVEALFEPLLHVLRNAIDHGIEPPDARVAVGKPAGATITLRARREGDHVIVELIDDGRGIDTAKVRRSAARLGLASDAELAAMSEQEVIELIFSPGFSTAATVTAVSGRGVGMGAVRAAVTRLGGRVTVSSQPGVGTTVQFILPFSVMMLRVMTVEVSGQSFGIPIDTVVETTRLPRGRISRLGAAGAIVLRDRTVPLIRLAEVLDLPRSASGSDADARVVVVALADQSDAGHHKTVQTAALEVDNLGERVDVMLKPMEGLLAGAPGFAGTTLLGDGRVLIVLDLRELLA